MCNIEETIENITNTNYVKNGDITKLTELYNQLCDNLSTNRKKLVEEFIEIIEKKKLNKDDKSVIKSYAPKIKKYLYIEEYEEEENEDDIINDESVLEIEKLLDSKVAKYNRFNENKPMKGITYSEQKKVWRYRNETIDKRFKNKAEAITYAKKNIPKNYEKFLKNGNILSKKYFYYKKYYFVIYQYNEDFLFDIEHIISVLNLEKHYHYEKYNDYVNKIKKILLEKNDFDGYFLRELISEKTMYNIILSSNSTFSKSFKNDVANILVELRKENKLIIKNDKLCLNKSLITNDCLLQSLNWENDDDYEYVNDLIKEGRKIKICEYINNHVLYMFLLYDMDNDNKMIIKVGYTENIIERSDKLKSEYGKIYLLKIAKIKGERTEKEFHKILKKQYPELIFDFSVNGKKKTELYLFHEQIVEEYDKFTNNEHKFNLHECQKIVNELEEEIDNELSNKKRDKLRINTLTSRYDRYMQQLIINEQEEQKRLTMNETEEQKRLTFKEERKTIRLRIKLLELQNNNN